MVLSHYRSLAKKGPWAVHITSCSDRGVADVCNIAAFYHKAPMLSYIITTDNRILQANTPAQYKLNSICVCIHR